MIRNKTICLISLFCLLALATFAQKEEVTFEKRTSFYPQATVLDKENIEWGYFIVPEDWENKTGKKIKLAVAILKKKSDTKEVNPLVMIEGGPGAGAVEGLGYWLYHPLREKSDIVLMDARGTGFSEPRLCPDLGKTFLQILAKNQDRTSDETEKANAALACKQQLITKGIDINAYHSANIAKDLHALKLYLQFPNWNVCSVSYGTYTAQVYAKMFPNDVKTLILDSPISDIKQYYTYNTSNYVSSLQKVFTACKNDAACNAEYPDLEKTYYQTIEKLDKEPITVAVEKTIIEAGTFTYNAEDFKVAIHQALYQKDLIEVLPLLIYQFYNGNKGTLSALVAAFSGALGLDYGMYYCVSCTETIPNNPITPYQEDASKYKALKGGLSFYQSDFVVCDQWNKQQDLAPRQETDSTKIMVPTLIFTGEFDPITPASNGREMLAGFGDPQLLTVGAYGHASSFSQPGFKVVNQFVNAPGTVLTTKDYDATASVDFVKDIHINGGITKFGNSLNELDWLFFAPLLIALLVCLIAVFVYCIGLLKNKDKDRLVKILKLLLVLSSLLGMGALGGLIAALNSTVSDNFYILAFGLPERYDYLFIMLSVFLLLVVVATILFFVRLKKMDNRSILFAVLFSNILLGIYFFYWGIMAPF